MSDPKAPDPAASGSGTSVKRLTIRKYPNRRYYDSTRSRHVTLEEIYNLIREGYEVQATDSKTGQDITAKVLAQIIIELDTHKLGVFPVPLLHRLLRSNERLVNDFIDKYFNVPLTQFLDSQRSMEQYFRQAMGFPSPTPTVADWTKMMFSPFNPSLWSGQTNGTSAAADSAPTSPSTEGAGGSAVAPPAPVGSSVPASGTDELRHVIEELRREVADLREQAGGKNRRPPKGSNDRANRPRRGRKPKAR